MRIVIICLLVFLAASSEKCASPTKKNVIHIYDDAPVITAKQYDTLSNLVTDLQKSNGIDLIVYTKDAMGNSDLKAYSDSILSRISSNNGKNIRWFAIFVYPENRFTQVRYSEDLRKYFDNGPADSLIGILTKNFAQYRYFGGIQSCITQIKLDLSNKHSN